MIALEAWLPTPPDQSLSGALPLALVVLPLLGAAVALLLRTAPRAAGTAGLVASVLVAGGALGLVV